MGCNKSKSQHGRSEGHVNGEKENAWELGQEVNSYYGVDHEFNHNENLNNGQYFGGAPNHHLSDHGGGGYSERHTGVTYSNVNVTGSFGVPDVASNAYGSNNEQYYCMNEYGDNLYRQRGSVSSESNNHSYRQEYVQETFVQHQHQIRFNQQYCHSIYNQEQLDGAPDQKVIMGPPAIPVAVHRNYDMPRFPTRLARRSSFNDDYRSNNYQVPLNYTLVRHGSLENIPNRFRSRNSRNNFTSHDNLFQISSVGNEGFPRHFNSRRRNLGRQNRRGLKRTSLYDDSFISISTLSDNSRPCSANSYLADSGPRVKRRSSNVDRASKPAEISSNGKIEDKPDVNYNNETRNIYESVNKLKFDDDEPYDINDLLMFPEEWSSYAINRTGLVDISPMSLEGKSVQTYFNRSSNCKDFKLSITAIERIENPFMHSYYLLKKKEMESLNRHVDELFLYHGTKKEHLSQILEDNLNWRLYSEKHRFGQGVSFSPLANYSSHYSDKTSEKVMLLFKVLASNSVSGSADMKVPPITDNVVYDTSIKEDATVIVKYSDNEFYPLYKITYTKIMKNRVRDF